LAAAGARLLPIATPAGPREALAALAARGITRVLVEGGAALATAFLRERLVDRLYLFSAPLLLGGDGRSAVESLGVARLADAQPWRRVEERRLGADRLAVLEPDSPSDTE
jgi:diaminohydroxyphosphoribosylaminopyrimidine deaminase/5-amino-6-(5-phosphoribosylamino)uracil reductase